MAAYGALVLIAQDQASNDSVSNPFFLLMGRAVSRADNLHVFLVQWPVGQALMSI